MIKLKTVLAVTTLSIAALTLADGGNSVTIQAMLVGTGKGKVTWKVSDKKTEKEAELQAEGENLARNATYTLTVGHNPAILVKTDAFGTYHYSARFTTTARPTIVSGDLATLANSASVVIETGKFATK